MITSSRTKFQKHYDNSENLFPHKIPIAKRKPDALNTPLIEMPKSGDGHILVVGTSGSGKSSCFVIPALRRWLGSVFLH